MKLLSLFAVTSLMIPSTAAPERGDTLEVQPRELDTTTPPSNIFDARWSLPETRTDGGRDLVREMSDLAALRFDAVCPVSERPLRTLGDLLELGAAMPRETRDDWLRRLEASTPALEDWSAALRQLLFDDKLRSKRWSPDDDHDRDGILTTSGSWNLAELDRGPWNQLSVRPLVDQAAVLVRATLSEIKRAEADYSRYPEDPGTAYMAIYPVPQSYFRGADASGRPYATLRVFVRSDLPFPFSSYACDVHQLHRETDGGRLFTDVYSTSDDFHWLAGRDVYLPVRTSGESGSEAESGERLVGWLVVRLYGFDLDGVPDKPKHRRAALRGSLGNLKRRAEALASGDACSWRPGSGLPPFQVLGPKD